MNDYETKLHNQYLEPEEDESSGKIGTEITFISGTNISTLTAS